MNHKSRKQWTLDPQNSVEQRCQYLYRAKDEYKEEELDECLPHENLGQPDCITSPCNNVNPTDITTSCIVIKTHLGIPKGIMGCIHRQPQTWSNKPKHLKEQFRKLFSDTWQSNKIFGYVLAIFTLKAKCHWKTNVSEVFIHVRHSWIFLILLLEWMVIQCDQKFDWQYIYFLRHDKFLLSHCKLIK